MKPITLLLLLLLPFGLFARNWTLEVRAAYDYPASKVIRDIYSRAWIDCEVFASRKVTDLVDVWAEVDWSIKKGRTGKDYWGDRDHTRAWVLPISAGARIVYPFNCRISVYLGGGITYSFLKVENKWDRNQYSRYTYFCHQPFRKTLYRSNFGGIVKTGLLINTGDNTFLDIFVDYISQRFRTGRNDYFNHDYVVEDYFDASGFKFGAGFGVNF